MKTALALQKMTTPEVHYYLSLLAHGLPLPDEHNYLFARKALGRRWKADFAYLREMVLVEVEGGMRPFHDPHTGRMVERGRHLTAEGYAGDCTKYNSAALLGYVVLRFTPEMVESGEAVETTRQALAMRMVGGGTAA